MDNSIINLSHVLFVAPLLIYVGYIGKKCNDMLFNLLLVLGVVVFLYHLSHYFSRSSKKTGESFENADYDVGDIVGDLSVGVTDEQVDAGLEGGNVSDGNVSDGNVSNAASTAEEIMLPPSNDGGDVEGFSW
jgi:hypothetical protein